MPPFQFKQFSVSHDKSLFKVNFDAVLLAAWADVHDRKYGLDIGAGSGVIALACCQRNLDLQMDAIEIDSASANEAEENFESSPFAERLKMIHTDLQSFALREVPKYDFIISNPPYFQHTNSTPTNSKVQTAKHTNNLSFEDLIIGVKRLMDKEGTFHLILPVAEGEVFIRLAKSKGLHLNKRTKVHGRVGKPIERFLMTFSLQTTDVNESELIVQKTGVRHDYTEEYIELVKDFYTIL